MCEKTQVLSYMPLQVYLGLALMMVTLPAVMRWFLRFFDDEIGLLLR